MTTWPEEVPCYICDRWAMLVGVHYPSGDAEYACYGRVHNFVRFAQLDDEVILLRPDTP
jgi:hypothetical protein